MNERKIFAVIVRTVGLLLMVWGLETLGSVVVILMQMSAMDSNGMPNNFAPPVVSIQLMTAGWRLGIGLFLLMGSGIVVKLAFRGMTALPGGKAVCAECGYELLGSEPRCRICGKPTAAETR
jgi:hypothetical protein